MGGEESCGRDNRTDAELLEDRARREVDGRGDRLLLEPLVARERRDDVPVLAGSQVLSATALARCVDRLALEPVLREFGCLGHPASDTRA